MEKWEAKKLLMKSKIYKIFAIAFAVAGGFMSLFLYDQTVGASLSGLAQRPGLILLLIIPFIPAMVFSFMASRYDAKVMKFFEENKTTPTS